MNIQSIDDAFRTCDSLLQQLVNNGEDVSEIESYLTRAIIVMIVSEYEDAIEQAFIKRADKCGDKPVCQYVRTKIHKTFRTPNMDNIKDLLRQFDLSYKNSFISNLNDEIEAKWHNLIQARHAVVHKAGILNITYRELKETYKTTRNVLDYVENAINS